MTMDKLKKCRICLAENVRLNVVADKNLQEIYEKLTDVPFVTEDRRPMLSCSMCYFTLKQCYQLRSKCLEAEELFAQMLNDTYETKPLINQALLECRSGFTIAPMTQSSMVDECRTERIFVKEELLIEPKEEHQSDELEPENVDSSCLDEADIPPHHSESDLEDDVPLLESKIEVEEEQVVFKNKRRASETTKLEPENVDSSCLDEADIPPHHSESESKFKIEVEEEQVVFKNKRRASETTTNDTHNWIHLDLRELHFTPSFSDDEKKKEDERRQKQKNKEYSKRYRDKRRISNLQTDPSARDVLDVQPVIHTSEIAKEKKKERNREYQRAWRQRKKDLKKKVSKEEKEEKRRKRHRENQRAYYQRTKGLKENTKNVEELFQKKLDDLQMKRKKLDSNEDQENVVHCRASQNLENVQLEQNQFLTQQLRKYEESHECITPKVILHRNTDIPGDGNCLFHSLIRVLQLQISTCDLRRQLRDSPYLNSCHNPQEAYNILSSNNEFGDMDCLYLFAKIYNQNICVHYHYFNVISKNEDTRFCHFKASDTHDWIHLDLRELHFTPYFTDDEKKKEDERKQKQKNKEYSKRYRDKKRISKQTGSSARDVLNVQTPAGQATRNCQIFPIKLEP